MERFGNASHDDIQKLMDKSKNKNTTNAMATWMNVCHTWVKHRRSALNIKSRTQKTYEILHFFYGTEKTSPKKAVKRRRVIISGD